MKSRSTVSISKTKLEEVKLRTMDRPKLYLIPHHKQTTSFTTTNIFLLRLRQDIFPGKLFHYFIVNPKTIKSNVSRFSKDLTRNNTSLRCFKHISKDILPLKAFITIKSSTIKTNSISYSLITFCFPGSCRNCSLTKQASP